MEAHAAAAAATVGMVAGTTLKLLGMVKPRYALKGDDGKALLQHPYQPWVEVPEEAREGAEKAYRAFKAYENSKEWLLLTLPLVWVFSACGEAVPRLPQAGVQVITAGVMAGYLVGDHLFFTGYCEAASKRMRGFRVRTNCFKALLALASVSAACLGLRALGVPLPA